MEEPKRYANNCDGDPYECKKPWEADCFVQCGEEGFVFTKGEEGASLYLTAFFEAFPQKPDTFIRGEGKTIEEAEGKAWEKLERYRACEGHEYERRGYKNGAGFCKHCGLFKKDAFEPIED